MTSALAVAALFISLVALAVAWWNGNSARRSADAAEGAQQAADRSADAAKDSAEAARQVASAELERDHESYRPDLSQAKFAYPRSRPKPPFEYTFVPSRRYRLRAYAGKAGEPMRDLTDGNFRAITSGVSVSIAAAEAGAEAHPDFLLLQFWPPAPAAGEEVWMCPCGRPTEPSEQPHWDMRVEVPRKRGKVVVF
ncbi:hypothetical protein [Actinoplanes derwentensis]|uniref:Uncharacterized protein n=1 Tax=Actinoplanes derwentensis TaxID=113562 RepID=A0A1H2CVH8_9ACTN|nr:hypothetical protein [Actinoplanes derwentensis]GID81981.1 hypothetical protein Ade03nite_09050 [Actinoplanes derwentensis]SDT74267.1 hypothetical protein SAMN04489716_6928 [Actinoplanes derwentensis]